MINIPWGNDFALKVPIKKKVIQTTGEIEIQDFDVSSVEQLHVFLQHNEHLPDWHSSQVEWSADPENSSGIIVEVSSQMAPIGMYNIILTGVQNGRRFFSQQCRQFKIIGNASSSDLVIYEGIQTYTLDEVIVLDARGRDGLSAYELAVARGFEGTESEWMATLKGENGNGVLGVELIEQVGNVDHYRMTFTDGTYFDYTVTNSSGSLTPEQIAEIVTELSNTISAGDLNAYTKTEVNNLLNSKANTSDIPTSLSDLNDDATHRTVTDTEKQTWNSKQEPISDLNTIRQNASNAYQKPNTGIPLSDLSEEVQDAIENAGSLTEESDPIFTASPAHGITASDITNWNGKYTKSNSGIPKTDLANDVQTSLGKADTALQDADLTPIENDIDAIEAKIPSAASSSNQLADKAFVNSSIATNTATFKGTFNSLAELQAVTGATNNDYGFVIEYDEQGNEYYDRYKYNGSAWVYEYKIESTPFTAAQWAAIQSGITSGDVEKLAALPTNAQLTALLNAKQDTINDLASIRSGASAGATAYQKPSGGIPKSDLSSAVQTSLGKADTALQSYTETDPVFSASPAAGITSSDITEWDGKAKPTTVVNHGTSDTTFSLTPNVLHVWGTVTSLTLTLATPTDSTIVNEYMFQFTSGSTATTLSLPSSVVWDKDKGTLTVESGYIYQVSILNNIALWARVAA